MQEPGEIEVGFDETGTERVIAKILRYRIPKATDAAQRQRQRPPTGSHSFAFMADKARSRLLHLQIRQGFTGPINYNRNLVRNWELNAPFTQGGDEERCALLEEVVVMEGVGHFLQEEKPHEISNHIYESIKKFKYS